MSSEPSSPNPSSQQTDDTLRTERLLLYADQSPFSTPKPGAQDNLADMNVARAHAAVAREKGAHAVRNLPLPLWTLGPIGAVMVVAGAYLGANLGAGPNLKGYDYTLTHPGEGDVSQVEVDPYQPEVWLASGKNEYNVACVSCHGAGGQGQPGVYPHLAGSEFVIGSEKRLAAIIMHGLAGPLTVDGKSFNGSMQAGGGSPKSDKQIAQIMSYIRNSWGHQASLVYDDQVAEFRKELGARSTQFTEAELRQIPEDANLPPSKRGGEAASEVPTEESALPPGQTDSTTPAPIPAGQ